MWLRFSNLGSIRACSSTCLITNGCHSSTNAWRSKAASPAARCATWPTARRHPTKHWAFSGYAMCLCLCSGLVRRTEKRGDVPQSDNLSHQRKLTTSGQCCFVARIIPCCRTRTLHRLHLLIHSDECVEFAEVCKCARGNQR